MNLDAYLIMTNVAPEDWSARINQIPRIIGRSPKADIRIPSRFERVSRKHAEIWVHEQETIQIRELGSTTGTKVNGIWLPTQQAIDLVLGDRLWLGGIELMVTAALFPDEKFVSKAELSFDYNNKASANFDPVNLPEDRDLLQQLTPAELDIALWIARGYVGDAELGRVLKRSANTVRTQMGRIFQKLDVHSRAELSSWLKKAGSVKPELAPPTVSMEVSTTATAPADGVRRSS